MHLPMPRLPGRATVLAGWLFALCLVAIAPASAADTGLVVIAHTGVPRLDAATLQRLYTGRAVEVAGAAATPVNAPPGSQARQRFLALVLQQDDDQYRAYWTVRRHVGKGAPPLEIPSPSDVIGFVQATPGAIGYLDAGELRPGLNVVWRP